MAKKEKFLKKQLDKLITVAVDSANDAGMEICGFLIDNGYFVELVQMNNKAKGGGKSSFYYNEVRLIQRVVTKMSHEIIGTFHSHPSSSIEPGDSDIQKTLDDSLMLIIDAADKKVALWYIKNKKKKKLEIELI